MSLPEYFHAAGTALLSGRNFTWHDDKNSPRVAIVNRRICAASSSALRTNAVGRSFKMPDGTRIQVVGIVEDGKYTSLTEDPLPAMFFPILQSPSPSTWLVVRSKRDPQQLAAALRATLRKLDPGLPVTSRRGTRIWTRCCLARAWRRFRWECWACWARCCRYRHLWHGRVLGEQTAAGVGNSHRARRAAEGSVAGGVGTAFDCWLLARWRDCCWEFWRPRCSLSSCTRRPRAIRWSWPGLFWRCRCWGCWQRGFLRNARCRRIH